MRPTTAAMLGASAVGGATLAYALSEARSFRVRELTIPVLPSGFEPLTVLHMTDLHLVPRQRAKVQWLATLATLEPDLVVGTGDFIADADAVDTLATALGPLLDRPGVFVLGSNDYFSPGLRNPLRYLTGPSENARVEPDLPWRELVEMLSSGGWKDLSNRETELIVRDVRLSFKGVDDPHIGRDDLVAVAGSWPADSNLRVGVAHAPYLRVLDQFASDSADLIFAGHTHGGQVCVPGYGALVTNCDLPRQYAKGLHRHAGAFVHVSAGVGTNPYTPIRFACPPEATLATLVPGPTGDSVRR